MLKSVLPPLSTGQWGAIVVEPIVRFELALRNVVDIFGSSLGAAGAKSLAPLSKGHRYRGNRSTLRTGHVMREVVTLMLPIGVLLFLAIYIAINPDLSWDFMSWVRDFMSWVRHFF